jgi:predicted DCC family thiol-disulfide oxidoreductase YuxK
MRSAIHVANPPPKPLMVFDGDCKFCGLWIRRWRQMTGKAVEYLQSQDPRVATQFPEIQSEHYQTSVQLIQPDGTVYSGSEAVFRALDTNRKTKWPLKIYESFPPFAATTECAYRLIASHRTVFSFLTWLGWGSHVERPEYWVTRWIFLRALGLIYLVAFISLWTQVAGLIGHNGILPEYQYMAAAKQYVDIHAIGLDRFREFPTLCWLNSSDGFLQFQCGAGVLLACLLIIGIAPVPALALLWLLYLSLATVAGNFLGFQWDILLLEAGFLAIFFAPLQLLPKFSREKPPSRVILWLLRILLFKLMFSSGCVKLASHDPNWRNLTALTFHYQTQPLPTWIGWVANQLPLWFQKSSCAAMFAVELGAPFLIFFPRRIRFFAATAIAFLQILILLTGNYTFFNWLTLALCLLLLDDFVLKKLLPDRLTEPVTRKTRPPWLLAITIPLAILFISVSILQVVSILGVRPDRGVLKRIARVAEWLEPFRTINGYGLFAVMTTERHEIILQGSNDGEHWSDYEFKYKPGDVSVYPKFVAPFQPRLDWQMWFAALGNYQDNLWFENFCLRLLQGSPEVLALLKHNPFPAKPPRFIRAELYNYEFTSLNELRATGTWWKRQPIGEYLPPVSLSE